MSTIAVHKKDEEGVLLIDKLTGIIDQPINERPEWAAGLAVADLAERHGYYASRLGDHYAEAHKFPDYFAFEDLQWLTMDETGEESKTILADDEHRQTTLAAALGMSRPDNLDDSVEFTQGRVLAEMEIVKDDTRTAAEMAELEQAKTEKFGTTG
jgi:hypothetical protein